MATTVYIPIAYKELAERLARSETGHAARPIFSTYMNLMVFAAMVGYASGEKREPLESRYRGPEVYDRIFQNEEKDGIAFLLALHEHKEEDILRENRDNECWRVIEGYAACGFKRINEWLLDAPTDLDGVDTLLSRMKEKAAAQIAEQKERLRPEIEF